MSPSFFLVANKHTLKSKYKKEKRYYAQPTIEGAQKLVFTDRSSPRILQGLFYPNYALFVGAAVDQKEDPHASSRRGVVRMLIICVVVFYVCYTFPSVVYLAE